MTMFSEGAACKRTWMYRICEICVFGNVTVGMWVHAPRLPSWFPHGSTLRRWVPRWSLGTHCVWVSAVFHGLGLALPQEIILTERIAFCVEQELLYYRATLDTMSDGPTTPSFSREAQRVSVTCSHHNTAEFHSVLNSGRLFILFCKTSSPFFLALFFNVLLLYENG